MCLVPQFLDFGFFLFGIFSNKTPHLFGILGGYFKRNLITQFQKNLAIHEWEMKDTTLLRCMRVVTSVVSINESPLYKVSFPTYLVLYPDSQSFLVRASEGFATPGL